MILNVSDKKKMDADVNIKTALAPKVVGYCINLLEDYLNENNNGTLKGFEEYYITKQGKQSLINASNMINDKGYSIEDAKQYVYTRVFKDTWNGKYWELEVKKELYLKGFKTRFSTREEDYKYCIDLVGDTFAIQVKPISYYKGSNPSLMIDKKRHRQAQLRYEDVSGRVVGFAFYNNKNNEILYKSKL
jgi:hypothetical protein